MTLIAKTILKNQNWVITDGHKKVGNVVADGAGYRVKIGNDVRQVEDTKSIEKIFHVSFDKPTKSKKEKLPYANWPTDSKTHNNFYDVQRKLHIYTKTKKSLCYHAAGYFKINMNGEWQTLFCPKYIFIQRYEYLGPFKTESEAKVA